MEIQVFPGEEYTTAQFVGPIDGEVKPQFDEHLHPLIESPGGKVLIDMTHVDRITSAGIGSLVTLVSRANTNGSKVVLANLSPFLQSVFTATRLTRFFEIADTTDQAIEKLQAE